MTLKGLAGTVSAVAVIVGAAFAVDARYWQVHAGEQAVADVGKVNAAAVAAVKQASDASIGRLSLSVEELRLKNELATARVRVQYLGAKAKPSPDDREELDFMRSQISLQQKQLLDVQAAQKK